MPLGSRYLLVGDRYLLVAVLKLRLGNPGGGEADRLPPVASVVPGGRCALPIKGLIMPSPLLEVMLLCMSVFASERT